MDKMQDIADAAINETPPTCRVTPAQAELIARNADALLPLGPEIVQGFYDTLFAHPPTAAVFSDGERPMREETLALWWSRTVKGPLDDDYWSWMALVGLTHVIRRVSNPMMLAMAEFVAEFVANNASRLEIPEAERSEVVDGFRRVASMTSWIITYAYDHAVSSALFDVAGMPEALLARLRDQEVSASLQQAHAERAER
ncbi:MAG: protoglobin domain-containing protein [Propioniciclava sp.]